MKDRFYRRLCKVLSLDVANDLMEWLIDSGFFEAPASTKYHGSYEGGLAEHSLQVCDLLTAKNNGYNLGLSDREVVVAGLLHDVCKVEFYKKEEKWRKVDGEWESYEAWVVDDKLPLGHGEKSIYSLQRFFDLTLNETYLIRWHMGPFSSLKGSKGVPYRYYDAVKKCPAIVAMFTADYEASTYLEP